MLIFLPHHHCHAINKTCITYYNLKLTLTCILYIIHCTIKFYCTTLKHHNLDTFKSKSCSGTEYTLNEYCRNHARFYSTDVENSRATPPSPQMPDKQSTVLTLQILKKDKKNSLRWVQKSLSSDGYVCHEHETSYSRHHVTQNSTCKSGDEMYMRCRQV